MDEGQGRIWRRTIFTLQRNRRQLMGALLLCVVGGGIYYVATKPKEPKSAGAWKSQLSGMISSDSTEDPALVADGSGAGDLPTGESGSVDSGALSKSQSPVKKKSASLLETGSASDLMEELLRIEDTRPRALPAKFILAGERIKIANRLLEIGLSEAQQLYAISSLIGATFEADALNNTEKMNADQIREELVRVRDKYCEHPNALIGSKASLGFPLVHMHNYFKTRDKSELAAAAEQFELHGDKILRDKNTVAFFSKFIVAQYRASDHSEEHRQLTSRIMKRMAKSENKDFKPIVDALADNIFFSKIDTSTLSDRIEGGSVVARKDVQSLFEGLDAHPSSHLRIYNVALNVIAEYYRLGFTDDADTLLKWLVAITEKNESEENRGHIAEGIVNLKKSLKTIQQEKVR